MAIVKSDTKELYLIGDKINNLSNDLYEKMNQLFNRIDSVPTTTFEWVGSSSVKFVELSKDERNKYYKLIDDLKKYGNFLCNLSESIDSYSYGMRDN